MFPLSNFGHHRVDLDVGLNHHDNFATCSIFDLIPWFVVVCLLFLAGLNEQHSSWVLLDMIYSLWNCLDLIPAMVTIVSMSFLDDNVTSTTTGSMSFSYDNGDISKIVIHVYLSTEWIFWWNYIVFSLFHIGHYCLYQMNSWFVINVMNLAFNFVCCNITFLSSVCLLHISTLAITVLPLVFNAWYIGI